MRRLFVVDEAMKPVGILSLSNLAREAERPSTSGGRRLTATQVTRTLAAVCQPRHRPEPTVTVPAAVPRGPRVDPLVARQADVDR